MLIRGDSIAGFTIFRQCGEGHTFTTKICPLCPRELGPEPEDGVVGRYGTGVCERCEGLFPKNGGNQTRCPACQAAHSVEWERRRNRERKK